MKKKKSSFGTGVNLHMPMVHFSLLSAVVLKTLHPNVTSYTIENKNLRDCQQTSSDHKDDTIAHN
jgi:hypothetical protein